MLPSICAATSRISVSAKSSCTVPPAPPCRPGTEAETITPGPLLSATFGAGALPPTLPSTRGVATPAPLLTAGNGARGGWLDAWCAQLVATRAVEAARTIRMRARERGIASMKRDVITLSGWELSARGTAARPGRAGRPRCPAGPPRHPAAAAIAALGACAAAQIRHSVYSR